MSIRTAMSLPDDLPKHPLGKPSRVKREEAEAKARQAQQQKIPVPPITNPDYYVTAQGTVARKGVYLQPGTPPTEADVLSAAQRAKSRGASHEQVTGAINSAGDRVMALRLLNRLNPGEEELNACWYAARARGAKARDLVEVLSAAEVPIYGRPDSARALRAMELLDAILPTEDMLPDGVREAGPGNYVARCCRCERDGPLFGGLDEIPLVGYEHYCGGSDRCCP